MRRTIRFSICLFALVATSRSALAVSDLLPWFRPEIGTSMRLERKCENLIELTLMGSRSERFIRARFHREDEKSVPLIDKTSVALENGKAITLIPDPRFGKMRRKSSEVEYLLSFPDM